MSEEILNDFSLEKLRDLNTQRCEKYFPGCKDWTLADWSNALAGEVGELCNLIKKIRRGDKIERRAIAEEFADVIIYVDILASQFNLDLDKIIVHKFNKVSKRVFCPLKFVEF